MPLELISSGDAARPVHLVRGDDLGAANLPEAARRWAELCGFKGGAGETLIVPDADGGIGCALFGLGKEDGPWSPLGFGVLARKLPDGDWRFADAPADPNLAALSLRLGGYVFGRYGKKDRGAVRFVLPEGAEAERVGRQADGVFLARDLVNTPANDMGPDALEAATMALSARFGASSSVVRGDDLLDRNLPMIHAVGRAAAQAPRLIELNWGRPDAPKVTLVGKGVCFDTGGLDIKTSAGMLLMKKDMGGAANALGLASMIMAGRLDVRLRVLIPAVENAIGGNSFRPGDVLTSRKGVTVEIGNTDAEGRLVLADALALADEEAPDLLIDLATLTGAARVALGPDLPPFYTRDDWLAADLAQAAAAVADPLWRMPLWKPYDAKLSSKVADMNNVTADGFAGSVVAALFLQRFVEKAGSWAHFDIFAWSPTDRPHCPAGGEAQAIRAIEDVLARRHGG